MAVVNELPLGDSCAPDRTLPKHGEK